MPRNITQQLCNAAQEGDLKKVRALLEKGADMNAAAYDDGYTAVMYALLEDQHEVWRYLLEAGASVEAKNTWGSTLLHIAAQAGNAEAVELLLDRGLPIESRDREQHTPLIEAAEFGALEVIECLLKHGADPNAREDSGGTSLHAAYRGALAAEEFDEHAAALVALLEKHGADPTIKDGIGRTPKDYLKQL